MVLAPSPVLELGRMKRFLVRFVPIFLLIGVAVAFYWKFFFRGLIPFPGDLMVGSYLPWLDYKWGNVVGVAVKNTFISDIFSAFYPWKVSFAQAFMEQEWPSWNPYLYSGYPLFANFNSGYLNPFNLLLVVFGSLKGWSLMVFSQPTLSMITMFLYLRTIGRSKFSSIIGSLVYGLGGFAMTWSQYVNAGFVMIWLPAILYVIELAQQKRNSKYLLALTPLFFLVVTAGHFQGLVYTAVITVAYYLFRIGIKDIKSLSIFLICSVLAIGISCVQLIPTIELLNNSVRFEDAMIAGYNFGLLPSQNIITMIAPDFFGNPSTGNFWGFYNYHETIAYAGIIGLLALIFGFLYYKKLSVSKFFVFSAVISLLLLFDTPLGKAIYQYKIPYLWTSASGRIGMIYLLSVSVLTSELVEWLGDLNIRSKIKLFIMPFLVLVTAGTISIVFLAMFKESVGGRFLAQDIAHLTVGVRNLVIPTGLLLSFFVVFLISQKTKYWGWLLFLLVIADLFRFGWKYLPFVPERYVFPATEVTDFIKQDKSIFRVDKERGEILPPNTWMGYDIMSPSGFDPLAVMTYVKAYREDLNGATGGSVSRYSELDGIDAAALGKYNVKYFLAIKRNEREELGGDKLTWKINQRDWTKVFETKSVAVLENTKYKERVRIVDEAGNDKNGTAEIVSYGNNRVVINFENIDGDRLLLADTYYPGWHAMLGGSELKIEDDIRPFRSVKLEKGTKGTVTFEYWPKSFEYGLKIAGVSLALWVVVFGFLARRQR
ncbi:MAG: putative membrane protein [Candidatus Collierbacteria bacterium GW2011_GWC2_43_12]|uniref:Putative membrane protein n=1 Tax=Candidatus Collierbacteria bacterium GW2011_GWC2_43_12 TaxID=1618390 RepID=A0A0G1D6K3_9BACT|nr:MAG: putative membrane protein [Candidatus Collierbacteria bacterium GW2011_GWC2_43_12]